MRYFRCDAGDASYEQARAVLDAAWGHPNASTKTITCIAPASVAPRSPQGLIVLAVKNEFCEYPAAAGMLELMLGSGAVSELTEAEYRASVAMNLP